MDSLYFLKKSHQILLQFSRKMNCENLRRSACAYVQKINTMEHSDELPRVTFHGYFISLQFSRDTEYLGVQYQRKLFLGIIYFK